MTALSALLLGAGLQAQSYRLMAVSGTVEVAAGSAWRRATTGSTLTSNDQLRISSGGYASVFVNNQRAVELKSPGIYKMSFLTASGAPSTTAQKYLNYVVNRSTSNQLGSNMSNLGAVERSMAPSPLSPHGVMPGGSEIEPAYIATEQLKLTWRPQSGATGYVVTISDALDGKEVFQRAVKDTLLTVTLESAGLQSDVLYEWQLSSSTMPGLKSVKLPFIVLDAEQRKKIQAEAKALRAEVGGTSAVAYLVLANFYQEKGVVDQAMDHYESAIALAPGVKEYRKMYAEFLQQCGLTAYALEMFKSAQ